MTSNIPELDDDQRAYEALFGLVPEWHAAPADPTKALEDDEALYRSLFGDDAA